MDQLRCWFFYQSILTSITLCNKSVLVIYTTLLNHRLIKRYDTDREKRTCVRKYGACNSNIFICYLIRPQSLVVRASRCQFSLIHRFGAGAHGPEFLALSGACPIDARILRFLLGVPQGLQEN